MPTKRSTIPKIGYLDGKLFKPARNKGMTDDMKAVVHPYAVADNVSGDVNNFFGKEVINRKDANRLAAHAEMLYAHNGAFTRKMRSSDGRDYLYGFMQHWASSMLLQEKPEYGHRLPQSFRSGGVPLWESKRR